MGRVSQAQAQENRRRVVDTASRLFREQGTQVSVADLMKAAGLTHGAFYKQFASKEALVDEAIAHAFDELTRRHAAGLEQYDGQRDTAQRALIDAYLSVEHRDDPADGCPVAAMATDIAREGGGHAARRVYTEGVADFADFLNGDDQDGIVRLCTLFGALVLSRATKGSPLSEEILIAAHGSLTETA
ncbi:MULTISPECIES: TetR family transcriptional regulator [unclassified Streptomyces]|uniref:TetR/AcrR family transcriptional regulator n=1 Tax=unclassified Streptomyces TaxID=2593676 RepID=UPI0006F696EA|nr:MULTISPECIES: TetR family transcriptional regulator [unclassified Streptomyces]KQX48054.1 TetR family transcriptional regulator [Streptomyces sp. Root1304]KRA82446.1 TetR family transcriptional regulator [Streptomyces sp. Root66D1]